MFNVQAKLVVVKLDDTVLDTLVKEVKLLLVVLEELV